MMCGMRQWKVEARMAERLTVGGELLKLGLLRGKKRKIKK